MKAHITTPPFPNFIIIGAMKCGTTSLFSALKQHPQIGLSSIKEPNYFGSSGKFWATNQSEYLALFEDVKSAVAIGEATATYFFDEAALLRIQAELNEETKIIILLRNPAKRAFSHWAHLRYYQLFETLSFEEALQLEDQREILDRYRPGTFRYFWGGLYSEKVKRCYEIFGQERVHVIILESIIQNPKDNFAKLFQFLGVNSEFEAEFKRENEARESVAPVLTRLITNRPAIIDKLYQLLPSSVQKLVFGLGSKVFYGLQKSRTTIQTLSPELYNQLMDKYMPDILSLEELLNQDLSVWYEGLRSDK